MKISKDIEQALRSLSYIERSKDRVSAKEISQNLLIPFEKLSKILQKLASHGIIESHKGRAGGYSLGKELSSLPLTELYRILGESYHLVPCFGGGSCDNHSLCTILPGMQSFQRELNRLLESYSLADFTGSLPKTKKKEVKGA